MCCEEHYNCFNDEYKINHKRKIMEPKFALRVEKLFLLYEGVIYHSKEKNNDNCFKHLMSMLALKISPCFTISILNFIKHLFSDEINSKSNTKKNSSKLTKDEIFNLINKNEEYKILIFNLFLHDYIDVKYAALSLLLNLYEYKPKEFKISFEFIKDNLLPEKKFALFNYNSLSPSNEDIKILSKYCIDKVNNLNTFNIYNHEDFICSSVFTFSYIYLNYIKFINLFISFLNLHQEIKCEILDILTDTCTEKYELVCFNKLYLISKLKQDININKYIVFAKANSNTSFNIGLLQDGNYLIEEIKVFKKGEINDYVLKMRNNFSGKIYNGVWGKENKSRIPLLKNEIPENDSEFYISIDELINYFSSLYICKIHPIENGNEYFSECIHYSKNEVNFPNIAVIDISNDTNIIIQFHQKNPKFCNINILSVTSYMIITDIDYEYIDSVSSVDSNYSIELNLKKGKYFLISDIIYRYIFSIDNFHGYTINTYSKEKINLLKNNENNLNLNINHKEIITNAVINYRNKSLAPKKHELDLDIYEQN